jgi:pyruvate,water dikinase
MSKAFPDGESIPRNLEPNSKELRCLFATEELMNKPDTNIGRVCRGIVQLIPQGWRYPDICQAKITLEENVYHSYHFQESRWVQSADIVVRGRTIGDIQVSYTRDISGEGRVVFLPEETRLIRTIAERLGHFIIYRQLKQSYDGESISPKEAVARKKEWQVVLDLLKQTDKNLYFNMSHKMLNQLCWSGIPEANELRQLAGAGNGLDERELERDSNQPHPRMLLKISDEIVEKIFVVAAEHLSDQDILNRIQRWIQEDKLSDLARLANRNLPIADVADAVRRQQQMEAEGANLSSASKRGVVVSLIRRFFSDQLPFINIAKNYTEIGDFYDILQRTIYSSESHGRLGGKSAGLYLAMKILRSSPQNAELFANVKVPKTWHVTSDLMYAFMNYNNFDDIIEQKYKDPEQIRDEYPYIVQTFKNAPFPPEIVKGISVALDEFEGKPLIVRSSSLLEDSVGAVFSGKYKSLFLTNQGSKKERLSALLDAIAEVYSSVFSSDPLEYRTERGLIDYAEEMGIMLQEVVGTRVGDYFMPTFAGVAFSNNEFRWSPRIGQKDGLLRIVMGLGTRAVDRVSDDYPVLISPGQPNLKVNASTDEVIRYSPRYADVINLKKNCFETIEIRTLLKEVGEEIPGANLLVSILRDDRLHKPMGAHIDFAHDDLLVTFEGLANDTNFVKQMKEILRLLEERMGFPVDIEFASDGKDFYLLQCRSQCRTDESLPSIIPRDVPPERIIFTANRNISNGRLADITHIVYVDPQKYSEISEHSHILELGRVVGKLNKVLPRRRFVLMGPGRWGSRGDIKLGVSVTYGDINNTAMLIEIARKSGGYVPDLSFGTHFFQDLVEANIRYLPLYPDEPGMIFNEKFLLESPNVFPDLLPNHAYLQDTIRVIDVPAATGGQVLRILLNAERDEAIALLV